ARPCDAPAGARVRRRRQCQARQGLAEDGGAGARVRRARARRRDAPRPHRGLRARCPAYARESEHAAGPHLARPDGGARRRGAARRLEAYAQKCLTFDSAHFAYRSLVLGNAAVHAFSLMPGTTGVGSLSRLKRRLKRPGEIKAVEKALAALAAARGMAAGELEEIGLPDYGFADGALEVAVGPATAVL